MQHAPVLDTSTSCPLMGVILLRYLLSRTLWLFLLKEVQMQVCEDCMGYIHRHGYCCASKRERKKTLHVVQFKNIFEIWTKNDQCESRPRAWTISESSAGSDSNPVHCSYRLSQTPNKMLNLLTACFCNIQNIITHVTSICV